MKEFRRFGTLSLEGCKGKVIVIYLKGHSVHMNDENEKNLKYFHGICGFKSANIKGHISLGFDAL